MANMLDYIHWRGDLSLTQSPFNEIDGLIFSSLAYLPFDALIPADGSDRMTIAEIHSHSVQQPDALQFRMADPQFVANCLALLPAMAQSARYADMTVSHFTNHIDPEEQTQFCAMAIELGDGTMYVAFRGTDDTIVGWKEDLHMCYLMPVPAQIEAVQYVERIAGDFSGGLRLGGHSKGGNLAIYSALYCNESTRERIVSAHSNDGPGFDDSVVSSEVYQTMAGRMQTFVPQSSIVGMLLNHGEHYTVVHSTQKWLLQHDTFSWEVERDHFVYLDEIAPEGQFVDKTVKEWIASVEVPQRAGFVNAMEQLLNATDATTVSGFLDDMRGNMTRMIRSLRDIDEPTRKMLTETMGAMFNTARSNRHLLKRRAEARPV